MRDPFLHSGHGNSIDVVPIPDSFLAEVLVIQERTFVRESIWQDDPFRSKEFIPSLDDFIDQSIEMNAISHGFSDDDIYLCIEVLPK